MTIISTAYRTCLSIRQLLMKNLQPRYGVYLSQVSRIPTDPLLFYICMQIYVDAKTTKVYYNYTGGSSYLCEAEALHISAIDLDDGIAWLQGRALAPVPHPLDQRQLPALPACCDAEAHAPSLASPQGHRHKLTSCASPRRSQVAWGRPRGVAGRAAIEATGWQLSWGHKWALGTGGTRWCRCTAYLWLRQREGTAGQITLGRLGVVVSQRWGRKGIVVVAVDE